jgi:hypothetical protein
LFFSLAFEAEAVAVEVNRIFNTTISAIDRRFGKKQPSVFALFQFAVRRRDIYLLCRALLTRTGPRYVRKKNKKKRIFLT